MPTLLLYGDKDVGSPIEVGAALDAPIHTSTLVVIPGVGHLSNFEAPERFNAEVPAFLQTAGAGLCSTGAAGPGEQHNKS